MEIKTTCEIWTDFDDIALTNNPRELEEGSKQWVSVESLKSYCEINNLDALLERLS